MFAHIIRRSCRKLSRPSSSSVLRDVVANPEALSVAPGGLSTTVAITPTTCSRSMSYFWRARNPKNRKPQPSYLKEVTCQVDGFRASWKKVNPLLRQIRGLPASEGLLQMRFSEKHKFAPMVSRVLRNACNLADIRYGLSEDDMVIKEATVQKGTPLKGIRYHARGRFGIQRRPKCHIRIVLGEMTPQDQFQLLSPQRRRELGIIDPADIPAPPELPDSMEDDGLGLKVAEMTEVPPPPPPPQSTSSSTTPTTTETSHDTDKEGKDPPSQPSSL